MMNIIEDIIKTIKEINVRSGYVPVGEKVFKPEDVNKFYLSEALDWIEEQLISFRLKNGLEARPK